MEIKLWKKLCVRALTDTASTKLLAANTVIDDTKLNVSYRDADLFHDVELDEYGYMADPVLQVRDGGRLGRNLAYEADSYQEDSGWNDRDADEWLMNA